MMAKNEELIAKMLIAFNAAQGQNRDAETRAGADKAVYAGMVNPMEAALEAGIEGGQLFIRPTPEALFEGFEDEDWNAKRIRLERAIQDAVFALFVERLGGASASEFVPEVRCPYRITIKYESPEGSLQ